MAAVSPSEPCGRAAGTLWGQGGATRIPRAARVTSPTTPPANTPAHPAGIALGVYVEKWKNRYDEAERKHKSCLLKSEKGQLWLRIV